MNSPSGINGIIFTGSTGISGNTGFSSTGISGSTGFSGYTGVSWVPFVPFKNDYLEEMLSSTRCWKCFNSKASFHILNENPIYKPYSNKFLKFAIYLINNYICICRECAIKSESYFLKSLPLEDLPLWINFKWVEPKHEDELKQRLFNGK